MLFLVGTLVLGFAGIAMAQHGQGSGHGGKSTSSHGSGGSSHSMAMKDRPVQSLTVEGFKVTLDVMTSEDHAKMAKDHGSSHGGAHDKSHHFMMTIQDAASKEIISDAKVSFTVQTASGEKETGKLSWMGDHYGGDIELKGKGEYQVQFLIESGGMEREAKFSYSQKG